MKLLPSVQQLSNQSLLTEILRLAASERGATVELIAAIAEVDGRRLYLGESCSSMFVYCTRLLHLSEHAAYDRIEVARLARRFPIVLEHLASGSLTLTNLRLLAPHLTAENVDALMKDAANKSKNEVEHLVARLRPQPSVPPTIRKLPADRRDDRDGNARQSSGGQASVSLPDVTIRADAPERPASAQPLVSSHRPAVVPLAPEHYKVQFTLSGAGREKLHRVQDLMRHIVPNGDLSVVFERALTVLLEDLESKKAGLVKQPREARSPRPDSRHISASVRRAVWKRDEGRCAFVGPRGRCTETGFLEFHHVKPYAAGGRAEVNNIELRCRAHNAYEAVLFFGDSVVRELPCVWGVETGPGTSADFGPLQFAAEGPVLEGSKKGVLFFERRTVRRPQTFHRR